MLRQIGLGHELFEKVCISPETPDHEVFYRKPSPKFGIEIIAEYGINKKDLFYVGDNVTDLLTAKNIGCMGVGVDTGLHDLRQSLKALDLVENFPLFDSFLQAAIYIAAYNG
jgi:D-glycero-D-manno-heptose 1,7-bisphosphate phosphatase